MKKFTILIIILILVLGVCCMLKFKNKKEGKDINVGSNNIEVEYKTGGGFGTTEDTALITITISNDKAIVSYEDELKKEISFNKSKYQELLDLINNKFSKIDKDADSNMDIMDGGDSYITIKDTKTGVSKTVGGYMPEDDNFLEIKDKIYEVIDSEEIRDFRRNELKNYFDKQFSEEFEDIDED
ncbi:MAG: hypothetical protein K6D97_06410 [Clostridia bacterium]|nr:hypothetical protein [Clostridia bacterium]